jgi:hypothetical protein
MKFKQVQMTRNADGSTSVKTVNRLEELLTGGSTGGNAVDWQPKIDEVKAIANKGVSDAAAAKTVADKGVADAAKAQADATAAKTTATTAKSTADTAKSTADTAKSTADTNKTSITALDNRVKTLESK